MKLKFISGTPIQKLLYGFLILFFLSVAAYRSVTLDFTNDEAFSFLNLDTLNIHAMCGTANTHWFNSLCMFCWMKLLGHDEWMLRIHSVLAIGFYVFFILKIYQPATNKWRLLLPITLLLGNIYLLDFFSLARGYASSLAFETIAIYLILKEKPSSTFYIYLFLSLATFSNYSCIYFLSAYFVVDVFDTFQQNGLPQLFKIDFLKNKIPFFLIIIWAIPNILFIKHVGDLTEGKKHGFIEDTLSNFFEKSYGLEHSVLLECFFTTLFIFMILCFLFQYQKTSTGFLKVFKSLMLVFLMIELCWYILKIPFPNGRTSFFFILPFLVVVTQVFISLLTKIPLLFQTLISISLFLFNIYYICFYRNLNNTIEYWKQQGIKECFQDLYQQEGSHIQAVHVGMSLDHYGSFTNYYRYLQSSHFPANVFVYSREVYNQMGQGERSQFAKQDYLLMLEDYKPFLYQLIPQQNLQFIKRYENMKTDLLKVGMHDPMK